MSIKLGKRRTFLIVITVVVLLFDGLIGGMKYYYGQQLQKQQADAAVVHKKLDSQIAAIKAKKAAEAKAAAQKADADAKLVDQQNGKVVTPAGCGIKGAHGDPTNIDVVVNKKHCFSPIDYVPSDLVTSFGATISAKIQPDFVAMYQAATAAGVPFTVTSSYRSYSNQVATYNNWVAVNGSTAAADTVSARPGYSEHQTGFAMDLAAGNCALECFLESAQFTWLSEHAYEYGFIQRYPVGLESITGYSSEAWHYRYVGKAVALEMKTKGIKTLEQLWNIPGGGY